MIHPLLDHLCEIGAVLHGGHTEDELRDAQTDLGLTLPEEFRRYYGDFRSCQLPEESGWNFFSLAAAVENTRFLRSHREVIRVDGMGVRSADVFAFCDYLIDAPTYCVVARPGAEKYGWILADQEGEGWFVGGGLNAFLSAFRRDGDFGLLFAN